MEEEEALSAGAGPNPVMGFFRRSAFDVDHVDVDVDEDNVVPSLVPVVAMSISVT